NGNSQIDSQPARVFLDKFLFNPQGSHCVFLSGNKTGDAQYDDKKILVLSVLTFSRDLIQAARAWQADVMANTAVQERMANMLIIQENIQLGKGGISIQ
ncbi:MAG: hypothetical protein V1735_08125, partial [Nanoarchaeota archaeon]